MINGEESIPKHRQKIELFADPNGLGLGPAVVDVPEVLLVDPAEKPNTHSKTIGKITTVVNQGK